MRICLITGLYPPHARGGAERVVEEEARALRAQGHDVSVITAEPLPEDGLVRVRASALDGIRVHRFYPLNFFFYGEMGRHGFLARAAWHLWDLFNPFPPRLIREILLKERPEVVHTHNLKGFGFLVPRLIRKLGLRHVHTLHDIQLSVPSGLLLKGREEPSLLARPFLAAYRAVTRALMGSPDVVISPSRFLLGHYGRLGFFPHSRRAFLANPAPPPLVLDRAPSKETRLLFLGQIEPHKGIFLLIETVKRLLKRRSDLRLEVVGTGSAAEDAAAMAGREMRITFHGRVHPSKFPELFSRVEYAVLPSICYENAPTVILESFAHGVPVIASDIGGAAELVRDGVNGLVVPAGDPAALEAAIRRACDETAEWPSRSRAALRAAEAHALPDHAERLADIYAGRDPGVAPEESSVPVRYVPPVSPAPLKKKTALARRRPKAKVL